MKVGSQNTDPRQFRHKNLNELTLDERRLAMTSLRNSEHWNPEWDRQRDGDAGLAFPTIASKHGNTEHCGNDGNPDTKIPEELFNFDLILNSRKFRVCCDTLLRIKTEEDLSQFSDTQILAALEKCASYRLTCFCAYVAAHKEFRRWQLYCDEWMAEKREEARQQIRIERLADKAEGLRKELGQTTAQELEDWILRHYAAEYRKNAETVLEWEQHEKVFLELRDTLKDRGMHLQSLLKMVGDHTERMTSSGAQV